MPTINAPVRVGSVDPENDEGQHANAGPRNNLQNTPTNLPPPNDFEQEKRRDTKQFSSLRAGLALAGNYPLHELADDTFLVSRWKGTRALPDLHAVASFLRQVGGGRRA